MSQNISPSRKFDEYWKNVSNIKVDRSGKSSLSDPSTEKNLSSGKKESDLKKSEQAKFHLYGSKSATTLVENPTHLRMRTQHSTTLSEPLSNEQSALHTERKHPSLKRNVDFSSTEEELFSQASLDVSEEKTKDISGEKSTTLKLEESLSKNKQSSSLRRKSRSRHRKKRDKVDIVCIDDNCEVVSGMNPLGVDSQCKSEISCVEDRVLKVEELNLLSIDDSFDRLNISLVPESVDKSICAETVEMVRSQDEEIDSGLISTIDTESERDVLPTLISETVDNGRSQQELILTVNDNIGSSSEDIDPFFTYFGEMEDEDFHSMMNQSNEDLVFLLEELESSKYDEEWHRNAIIESCNCLGQDPSLYESFSRAQMIHESELKGSGIQSTEESFESGDEIVYSVSDTYTKSDQSGLITQDLKVRSCISEGLEIENLSSLFKSSDDDRMSDTDEDSDEEIFYDAVEYFPNRDCISTESQKGTSTMIELKTEELEKENKDETYQNYLKILKEKNPQYNNDMIQEVANMFLGISDDDHASQYSIRSGCFPEQQNDKLNTHVEESMNCRQPHSLSKSTQIMINRIEPTSVSPSGSRNDRSRSNISLGFKGRIAFDEINITPEEPEVKRYKPNNPRSKGCIMFDEIQSMTPPNDRDFNRKQYEQLELLCNSQDVASKKSLWSILTDTPTYHNMDVYLASSAKTKMVYKTSVDDVLNSIDDVVLETTKPKIKYFDAANNNIPIEKATTELSQIVLDREMEQVDLNQTSIEDSIHVINDEWNYFNTGSLNDPIGSMRSRCKVDPMQQVLHGSTTNQGEVINLPLDERYESVKADLSTVFDPDKTSHRHTYGQKRPKVIVLCKYRTHRSFPKEVFQ
ncbi:MAG: hypothetical protein MJA29_02820 [Candidatus Omnitrophica bacterium]|nr:hypothetical protein [Candidatus Omnitrophota bacterium]